MYKVASANAQRRAREAADIRAAADGPRDEGEGEGGTPAAGQDAALRGVAGEAGGEG